MGSGPISDAAIAVVCRARSLGRNHGCPQGRFRGAFPPERRAFAGLLQSLQDLAADTNILRGRAAACVRKGKTTFGIEVSVFGAQAEPAIRNLADAAPAPGDNTKHLGQELTGPQVSLGTNGPRILVFNLGAPCLELLH